MLTRSLKPKPNTALGFSGPKLKIWLMGAAAQHFSFLKLKSMHHHPVVCYRYRFELR
jgi:hypothetical protein